MELNTAPEKGGDGTGSSDQLSDEEGAQGRERERDREREREKDQCRKVFIMCLITSSLMSPTIQPCFGSRAEISLFVLQRH